MQLGAIPPAGPSIYDAINNMHARKVDLLLHAYIQYVDACSRAAQRVIYECPIALNNRGLSTGPSTD